MPTLSELVNNVCNEHLNRDDLTANCSAAVAQAILQFDHRRWWFSEASASFTTTSTTSVYTLPADFKSMDYVEARWPGDNWQEVRPRDFAQVRHMLEGQDVTGYPEIYAIRQEQIHVAYQPNAEYLVREYYVKNLAALSASGSNEWTTDFADLIAAKAAKSVALRKLHDPGLAQLFAAEARELEYELIRRNDAFVAQSTVRPWS
jgi:hypothetical protein